MVRFRHKQHLVRDGKGSFLIFWESINTRCLQEDPVVSHLQMLTYCLEWVSLAWQPSCLAVKTSPSLVDWATKSGLQILPISNTFCFPSSWTPLREPHKWWVVSFRPMREQHMETQKQKQFKPVPNTMCQRVKQFNNWTQKSQALALNLANPFPLIYKLSHPTKRFILKRPRSWQG